MNKPKVTLNDWKKILSSHNATTRGPKCKGMEGIVAEGAEMIDEEVDEDVKDAGLIAAAQRVEHYEMAGSGPKHKEQ